MSTEKLIEDFPKIANTVTELTRISGVTSAYEILSNAERHIEQTDYDNWDGGTYIHTIYLKTAIDIFARYESQLEQIENSIKSKFEQILKNYPSNVIGKLVITPRLLTAENTNFTAKTVLDKYAFISYQVKDKSIAGSVRQLLEGAGINSFLAHEDIDVSLDWQDKILEEMSKASIFVCLISANYLSSPWCLQEAGMAMLKNITIIPISIDGMIPNGFIAKYQATKIDPERPRINDLIPGLLKHNKFDGLNMIIDLIGASSTYRGAEANFQMILPYVNDLTEIQIKTLFNKIRSNDQIHHAGLCASEYIPPLLRRYKNIVPEDDFNYLKDVCAQYNGIV